MSFTQPFCDPCSAVRMGARRPVRVNNEHREMEICADCGAQTWSGIYLRVDPATLAHPTVEPFG